MTNFILGFLVGFLAGVAFCVLSAFLTLRSWRK